MQNELHDSQKKVAELNHQICELKEAAEKDQTLFDNLETRHRTLQTEHQTLQHSYDVALAHITLLNILIGNRANLAVLLKRI